LVIVLVLCFSDFVFSLWQSLQRGCKLSIIFLPPNANGIIWSISISLKSSNSIWQILHLYSLYEAIELRYI